MKIAAIGAGGWGKNIVRTLYELDVLFAVSDIDKKVIKDLEQAFPELQIKSDYQSILANDEIDAVTIATPVPTHYKATKEALLAGKDVFVEKPLTLNIAEAEELVDIAVRKDRILMVGHLLLYQPAVQWIREYLKSGHLGKVHSIHQDRLNLGTVREVENTLWSLGVHDVAVINYLLGEAPRTINASGHSVLQKGIEDDQFLHMYFEGNIQAHLHTSWLWPKKQRQMTIICSGGILVYDELKQNVTLHKKSIDKELNNINKGEEVVFEGSGQPLTIEMEHFIECVRERKKPKSDGQSGMEVIRVLQNATELLSKDMIPA